MSKSASTRPDKLTDQATLNSTISVLMRHFALSAQGYCCQTADIYRILVTAAATHSSIEATCKKLAGPDSNTVRGYLKDQLTPDQITDLQQRCNQVLYSQWPHWLRDRPLNVAIDLHDEPYYGEPEDDDPASYVCRCQKRAGTTRCYSCATLCAIRDRLQVQLAVVFVRPTEDLVDLVKTLLKYVRLRGLHIGCLYADKEFATIPVMRYLLRETQLSAIIAVPRKGDTGGVNALCHGPVSYDTTHTFASRAYGELTVPVGIVRAFKEAHGQRSGTWLVYALIRVELPLHRVRETYRSRFGIDTKYRCMEQVRARTTAKNPALRFFLMAIALVLVNVWMALQWTYCRVPGSGPRRIVPGLLTLAQMAFFLIHAVETHYGVVTQIASP